MNCRKMIELLTYIICSLQTLEVYCDYLDFDFLYDSIRLLRCDNKYPEAYRPYYTFDVTIKPRDTGSELWDEEKIAYALTCFNDTLLRNHKQFITGFGKPIDFNYLSYEELSKNLVITNIKAIDGTMKLELVLITNILDREYVSASERAYRRFLL